MRGLLLQLRVVLLLLLLLVVVLLLLLLLVVVLLLRLLLQQLLLLVRLLQLLLLLLLLLVVPLLLLRQPQWLAMPLESQVLVLANDPAAVDVSESCAKFLTIITTNSCYVEFRSCVAAGLRARKHVFACAHAYV